MVLALSPDSLATLMKLNPRAMPALTDSSFPEAKACNHRGRARAKTLSKNSTAADLPNDWRNVRREEDKRVVPSRSWLVLEFAPTLLRASRLCKFRRVS